jgi:hypothetical protein
VSRSAGPDQPRHRRRPGRRPRLARATAPGTAIRRRGDLMPGAAQRSRERRRPGRRVIAVIGCVRVTRGMVRRPTSSSFEEPVEAIEMGRALVSNAPFGAVGRCSRTCGSRGNSRRHARRLAGPGEHTLGSLDDLRTDAPVSPTRRADRPRSRPAVQPSSIGTRPALTPTTLDAATECDLDRRQHRLRSPGRRRSRHMIDAPGPLSRSRTPSGTSFWLGAKARE